MDFLTINTRVKNKNIEVYPNFKVGPSKDLMIRAGEPYAIWNEAKGLWDKDYASIVQLIDDYVRDNKEEGTQLFLKDNSSRMYSEFLRYCKDIKNNGSRQLDENLTFANSEVKKTSYASKRLPYSLEEGSIDAWNELINVLYSPEERQKIEWAIGSIVAGESKHIQKFFVFYGPGGVGKSTVLKIIEDLFEGYTAVFDAKGLSSATSSFATASFKNNPLVAIQHDGDLSRIEDNTRINSIVSHETMIINEKFKSETQMKVNAMLFMGTNTPVNITDMKSGIIRRLVVIEPTGKLVASERYHQLINQIKFEHGAIAYHCLQVYKELGRSYFDGYRPQSMVAKTNLFDNFIESHYDELKDKKAVTQKYLWEKYKEWCDYSAIRYPLNLSKFKNEVSNYFDHFHATLRVDGVQMRSVYSGFKYDVRGIVVDSPKEFELTKKTSIFDKLMADQPAQYAKEDGTPEKKWENVKTKLKDLDTSKTHYVQVPENHVVIDFDLKDEDGHKSLERNLEAASGFPSTYGELSQGGAGVHLHFTYDGDTSRLSRDYDDGIEVKVYRGNSALRRRVSLCNDEPVATINSGLPIKEEKPMIDVKTLKSEKALRDLIGRNLRKEIHPGTKPSIDFIKKILDDAYNEGLIYDVSDLKPKIIAFANNSTNQPLIALKTVKEMKFASEKEENSQGDISEKRLVFYDVEVYPNLFVVCWKYEGADEVVRMINPTPEEVEALFSYKLVGFNNRRYDNHILWGRFMGFSNEQLFKLSQSIINNERSAMFGEAYNLSYADIYDFSSKKQGLKKFQIELGIPHKEMDIPWEQPVPDDRIDDVVDYCANDVKATEAVFNARKEDFAARQILAELANGTVNDTTQKLTAKIIFANDKNPSSKFIYTDLSKEFDGYEFDRGVSTYRGEVVGEGGYVYAEPGMYNNVVVLDIASMHPTSIEQLSLFGPYTKNFSDLKAARLAIKHGKLDEARLMLNGKLAPYLDNSDSSDALSYALKIVINIVYGLTSAKFDNPFRDIRNRDNIVAKRGALFMIDLKHAVQEQGFQVVHIKTDSIKIPNATPEIIKFIEEYGAKYGYEFENEGVYDTFCLVNDAVYIARKGDKWDAVGAQFAHPYVFKTLFSKEPIEFEDLCETKQVTQGSIYMDFETDRPAVLSDGLHFVGRTGRFTPVKKDAGGAVLYRVKDDKSYAVTGTKGYLWLESDMAKDKGEECVDMTYFETLVDKAIKTLKEHGSSVEAMLA